MTDDLDEPWLRPETAAEPLDTALLTETIAALSDRLAAQEDLLAALVDKLDQQDTPGGQWTWRYLNPDQQEALLAELNDWVTWLVDRYQLGSTRHQIPHCWAEHPVAVEELTALMVAWKAAYAGRNRPPRDDLINWHDRWLWPCLARLNDGLNSWNQCRRGSHVPINHPETPVQQYAAHIIGKGVRS